MDALRQYLREHQRDYAQLGKLGEAERDRVEEEVGAYVRSCSANIDKLQQMLAAAPPGGSPARQPPNADMVAHRQGQVLILSERLRSAAALFDRLRSLRYQQLQAAEAARLRRLPQHGAAGAAGGPTTGEVHARLQQAASKVAEWQQQQQQGGEPGGSGGGGQQQQQIQLENQALQLELMGMHNQASSPLLRLWLPPVGLGAAPCWGHLPGSMHGPCCSCSLPSASASPPLPSCPPAWPAPCHPLLLPRPACRCSMRSAACARLPHSTRCSARPSCSRGSR